MNNELLATCWTFAGDIDTFADNPRSPLDPVDRIHALARNGFTGADFLIGDLQGQDLSRIREALDESGIVHRQVELLSGWWKDTAGASSDEALELAEGIGATQLKAAPNLEDPTQPFWDMRDSWVRLAERAETVGAQLIIEAMPFSNLRTVEEGARFVQAAGHPNGGTVVDYWHVKRGGSTFASMKDAIDPQHLFAIELCDGNGPKNVGEDMLYDANTARELPGEGEWDVHGFVATMREIGYDGPWGIEMPAPWYLKLPLDEALARTARSTLAVLDEA